MHIHSTLYISSRSSDLYVPPKHTETYTHILYIHLSLTPLSWEKGSGSLRGGARLGEETEEPSLTWGMGPDSTKPHSLLLHVENGRRARGGGGRRQKKEKKWRKEEEAVRERQLVGSANHQGNTHLIDMWNLNSSYKLIGSNTMDQSSERQLRARPRTLLEVAVLLGGKVAHKEIITHYAFNPFK